MHNILQAGGNGPRGNIWDTKRNNEQKDDTNGEKIFPTYNHKGLPEYKIILMKQKTKKQKNKWLCRIVSKRHE